MESTDIDTKGIMLEYIERVGSSGFFTDVVQARREAWDYTVILRVKVIELVLDSPLRTFLEKGHIGLTKHVSLRNRNRN